MAASRFRDRVRANKVVNFVRFAHWDAQQAARLLPRR